jgi:hypothetical protein
MEKGSAAEQDQAFSSSILAIDLLLSKVVDEDLLVQNLTKMWSVASLSIWRGKG